MGRGRDTGPDRPVEPEEAKAHGNDPDAVEIHDAGGEQGTSSEGDGPRRVGDLREEREETGAEGRTEGDEHLRDPDAGTNRATSEAGRQTATADAQEGWNIPSNNLPAIGSQDLPEPVPLGKLVGASVVLLATALGSGELIIWPYITTQGCLRLLWFAVVGFSLQYFLNM